MDDTLRALNSIDPSRLTYQEWLEIGIALKAEGYSVSTWADWSRSDPRFQEHDLDKWGGFDANTMTKATIFHYAKLYGNYTSHRALSWDDGLKANYEEVLTAQKPVEDEQPYEMAIRYLETLYKPDEWVSYVTSAEFREDQHKWVPANGGSLRKCEDIIKDLKEGKDIEAGFGTMNAAAGAWIRHNPAKGPNDKDVTAFRHVLVESDVLDIEDQKKILIESELPISALIESGGKSIHAIVKIDAADEAEYKKRVNFLFEYMSNKGFVIDKNNKNPARLSRLPGAMRGDKRQKLIGTHLGRASWLDWKDFIDGIMDNLPPILDFWEQVQRPPQLSPELIAGVLRCGNKMIITGESKAGKTCLSQNLAVCLASGRPWLGKFQCKKGKVLYINLEVEEASLFCRFKQIFEANGWGFNEQDCRNIRPWNLRGKAVPLDELADSVIRRCRNEGPFIAIILDPLYKVQQGDENSAEAIIKFCNALDRIAHETGAAIIYDHHHPKGAAKDKLIDRGAGSGVFARDADAICDLSFLSPDKELLETVGARLESGEKPMQIGFILRDFKDIKPINIWFKFPVHYVDSANLLEDAPIEGSKEDNLNKSNKRTTRNERHNLLSQIFEMCSENGEASLADMVDWCGGKPSKRTLERYVGEFDDFELKKGIVRKCGE